MFWFKRKEIVVDCFTTLRGVYELYKPERSIEFFPEQIKNINSTFDEVDEGTKITLNRPTIKSCVGVIDYYKTGFILPMWADFVCQPTTAAKNESAIALMERPFFYHSHTTNQYAGMFVDYLHVKLGSPWLFREKSGIKFGWNSAVWNLQKHVSNFVVLPGVVSYNHQCQTNVNIFVDKKSDNFILTAGTPLVHITPITENKVKLRHHLVDQNEYSKIGMPTDFPSIRPGMYNRWVRETNKVSKKRCPFGFGND